MKKRHPFSIGDLAENQPRTALFFSITVFFVRMRISSVWKTRLARVARKSSGGMRH
jgi:hypothetical protein